MQVSNIEFMAQAIVELGRVECDFIEYKKSDEQKASILKTACAYANNYMNREIGLIILGVEEMDEDTGEKAVPKRPVQGIGQDKLETLENGLKSLFAHIHPRINYHFLDITVDGRCCPVIAVEPGSDGPYETSEKAERDKNIRLKAGRYIRVRRDTRLPNKREEFELLKKFADFHFSSELNETATLDDLNYEWMREYLVRTNAAQDVRELPKLEMAQALGLVSGSEYGGYRAKNFAVLMFADRPQDFIPYARVEIIREAKGTDDMEATVFDGPIWMQVNRAIDFFEEVIQRSYTVRRSEFVGHKMVYNWPRTAFVELLTNAVMHKEYDKKEYVGVYVYENSLSFINHNRPLPPVTIEDMNKQEEFRDREYLNPEIKEMFFALNLIQSYGSGIRRAKRAMAENGNPPLLFEPLNDTDDYTMVTCPVNEEFAYIRDHEDVATRKPSEITVTNAQDTTSKHESYTPMTSISSEKTSERIKIYLRSKPTASAKEMASAFGLSQRAIEYQLQTLRQIGSIRRTGPAKGGSWVVIDEEGKDAEG